MPRTIEPKTPKRVKQMLATLADEQAKLPKINEAERLELYYSRGMPLFSREQQVQEYARISRFTDSEVERFSLDLSRQRSAARVPGAQFVAGTEGNRSFHMLAELICTISSCGHFVSPSLDDGTGALPSCPICATRLLPHNSNPLHFIKTELSPKKLYLGAELEVEVPGFKEKAWLPEFKPLFENFAILKGDSSIHEGFEICTAPWELPRHQAAWERIFTHKLFERIKADDQPNVGLHIHASRAPLSAGQIARFVYFMNAPENYRAIVEVAGREANGYTQYNPGVTRKLAHNKVKLGREGNNHKYEVVNLLHPKSIEVRAFQSTKEFPLMMARLEFVQACLSFVDMKTSKDLVWPKFMDWLSEAPNRKRYGSLVDFVALAKKPAPIVGNSQPGRGSRTIDWASIANDGGGTNTSAIRLPLPSRR